MAFSQCLTPTTRSWNTRRGRCDRVHRVALGGDRDRASCARLSRQCNDLIRCRARWRPNGRVTAHLIYSLTLEMLPYGPSNQFFAVILGLAAGRLDREVRLHRHGPLVGGRGSMSSCRTPSREAALLPHGPPRSRELFTAKRLTWSKQRPAASDLTTPLPAPRTGRRVRGVTGCPSPASGRFNRPGGASSDDPWLRQSHVRGIVSRIHVSVLRFWNSFSQRRD